MLTWSYETNPACNVLVGENSEVTAAKSTILETNKSSSNRPKTSTASTTSTSSTNSQPSSNTSSGGSGGGGKQPSIQQYKRIRRSVPSLHAINDGTQTVLSSVLTTVKPSSHVVSLLSPSPTSLNLHFNKLKPKPTSSASSSDLASGLSLLSNSLSSAATNTLTNNIANNVAQIDIGESSGYGNTDDSEPNELHASLSSVNALVHDSNRIDNDDSVNAYDNSNGFVDVFDVTYSSNDNQEITTVINNRNGYDEFDLITDSFVESPAFDITNDNKNDINGLETKGDAGNERPEEMLQNDGPTIITHDNQLNMAIVNLDNDESLTMQSNSPDDASPHRLLSSATLPAASKEIRTRNTSKHKPALSADIENDIDKYSYVETSYPEPTYYQMHDSNNDSINLHDQQTQRILVNVSIATDSGAGTQNHGVYMLQVSVPAGPDFLPPHINAPIVHAKDMPHITHERLNYQAEDDVRERPPKIPPQPPCPCQCAEEFFTTSKPSSSFPNLSEAATDTTPTATSIATNGSSIHDANDVYLSTVIPDIATHTVNTTTTNNLIRTTSATTPESRPCLENQDIPTILILEGERGVIRELFAPFYSLLSIKSIVQRHIKTSAF